MRVSYDILQLVCLRFYWCCHYLITLERTVCLRLEKPDCNIWLTLKALNLGWIAARIELADQRSFDGWRTNQFGNRETDQL